MDKRGEDLEIWQDDNKLLLINKHDDKGTFYSRVWHTTTTPDVAFFSGNLEWDITRTVAKQLGGSDHRPVILTVENEYENKNSTLPRWNYKKADWAMFRHRTSILVGPIETEDKDVNTIVDELNTCILQAAHETIPRGAYKNYKPYWSKELGELQDKVEAARTAAEERPSQDNHNKYQHAKAIFQRTKIQARRTSWKEKTETLNMEKDGRKLWRLAKQINDEGQSRGSKITLVEGGKTHTGKQAADHLANNFARDCNINVSSYQQHSVRDQQPDDNEQDLAETALMNSPILQSELDLAISKLKNKKSPGPDGVTNEMIKNLGSAAMKKLLEIMNISWTSGNIPQGWREATMVPILKAGNDSTSANSYRPISITSCLCKTMERIVNNRLKYYLEKEQLLSPQQAGFRQCYSTEDQATYLSQEVEDAFQENNLVQAVWIDLKKAFDKVWKEGLLWKMRKCKIKGNLYKWTKSYLHNRKARVQLNGYRSKKVLLRHGVPQGGVLSPTLFLIFIDDLVAELPHGIKVALYADDLVMWCIDKYATTATKRLQRAVDALKRWTDKWCITINTEKSSTTLYIINEAEGRNNTFRWGPT
jgi:hypothetical protein